MDNWANSPRWALVYGLHTYIIYLVLPVVVDNQRRCSFISSGALSVYDVQQPYFALLLYMMLSSYMTHEELVKTLGVKLPSGCHLGLPDEPKEVYTGKISKESVLSSCMFFGQLTPLQRF
jgi:hypothetical protein